MKNFIILIALLPCSVLKNFLIVTVQAKTSLVHTSNFVNLKTHNKSCKFQPVMLFLKIFMSCQSDRIGGVNKAGFCSDSHNFPVKHKVA